MLDATFVLYFWAEEIDDTVSKNRTPESFYYIFAKNALI